MEIAEIHAHGLDNLGFVGWVACVALEPLARIAGSWGTLTDVPVMRHALLVNNALGLAFLANVFHELAASDLTLRVTLQ